MSITYESLLAQRAEHHKAFGQMLRRWRAANGCGIHDPSMLGETVGFRPVAHDLWRQLEEGLAGELPSSTFIALGETNRIAAVPIDDWTPTEFWACYCGLLEVPERWRQR